MKRPFFLRLILICALILTVLVLSPSGDVQALPEYSSQTGETCATCHISPSGGGARGPRGQAWIAADKPGSVPDLLSSLKLLGVELDIDPAEFSDVPEEILPAQPLLTEPGEADQIYQHLFDYPGN